MLKGMTGHLKDHIGSYIHWFYLYMLRSMDFYEVAIVGNQYDELKAEMGQFFLPNAIVMGGADEGSLELLKYKLVENKTYIYVCKDKMCKLPVDNVEDALAQLK